MRANIYHCNFLRVVISISKYSWKEERDNHRHRRHHHHHLHHHYHHHHLFARIVGSGDLQEIGNRCNELL